MIHAFNNRVWGWVWALLALGLVAQPAAGEASLTLVENGQAGAQIVIGAQADVTEAWAARELQTAVRQMSGAQLPVGHGLSDSAVNLVLGTPADNPLIAARQSAFQGDLDFLKGSDGFAVRTEGRTIYIFAHQPKGVLNGVYSFLEENAPILWYRGGEAGAAYRPSKTITASHADYRSRPAFAVRGWHLVVTGQDLLGTEEWMARNGCNFKATQAGREEKELRRLGLRSVIPSGHNLHQFLPNKLFFESHPEYYAMIDGQRRPLGGRTQICFSNMEGAKAFTDQVLAYAAKMPREDEIQFGFGINMQDNWGLCQCPLCSRAIHLPDGTVVKPEDEAFRSTQYYLFLNQVARAFYGKYPNKRLVTYGYFFSAVPPKVKPFKNMDIVFCLAVRDDKHPLDSTYNEKWTKRLKEWVAIAGPDQVILRDYYANGAGFSRPMAQVVATDFQLYHKLGLRGIYAELFPDNQRLSRGEPLSVYWDASAMQFWLITRLMWNPEADLNALRQRYLERVYGPAAGAMGQYYKLIHDSWYASDQVEYFGAKPEGLAKRYIASGGIEDQCREALERAGAAAASDPMVGARVAAVRGRFDTWMKAIAAHPTPDVAVPRVKVDPSQVADLSAPAWAKAAVVDRFAVMGHPQTPAKNRTIVRVMYDAANLYIGVECQGGNPAGALAAKVEPYEQFPSGDHVEIFLGGGGKQKGMYYQLAFNAAGTKYDGAGFDKSWNGPWTVRVRVQGKTWQGVATIPWTTLGVKPAAGEALPVLFFRQADGQGDQPRERSSWGGGTVHAASEFGTMTLK